MLDTQTRLNDFVAQKGIKKTSIMYHIASLGISPCGYITSAITKRPSYLWYIADLERAAKLLGKRRV